MVLLADDSTMITPITLSSTLSRMAAKNFGSASGNTASHCLWCDCGECCWIQQAQWLSVAECVCWNASSSRRVMNNISHSTASLSLTHAARDCRRKQKTLLMSCFKLCKSCHSAGCVLEDAVDLQCCVDSYRVN